ncbi:MAG: hypothetical protein CR997_00980 [Acidobacteria bacterium]|nr:MAG: hypothetical protein CR997_00980 [Acidobacteriota bacterium]
MKTNTKMNENWPKRLIGLRLYLPSKHELGFEFVGARVYRGLRIITASDWSLKYYGGTVLDSSSLSTFGVASFLLNMNSDWGLINEVSRKLPQYISFKTKGYCSLDIGFENNRALQIRIQVDGKTIYEHWD